MSATYNLKSSAVKRLMKEAEEMRTPTYLFFAQPLEDNLFEWHFTIRGPKDSDFERGTYHGRILIPSDYPMKPPNIILLTPNGRFETNKKICLSISGYHPETWQPSWSIRTALLAIIGFMPTHGAGSIGSLDYTSEERKKLALKSQEWSCNECGKINILLLDVDDESTNKSDREEAKKLAQEYTLKDGDDKLPNTASQNITAVEPTIEDSKESSQAEAIKHGEAILSKMTDNSPSKEMLIRRLAALKKIVVTTTSHLDVGSKSPLTATITSANSLSLPTPNITNNNNFNANGISTANGTNLQNPLANSSIDNNNVAQTLHLSTANNIDQTFWAQCFSRRYIWSNLAILAIGLLLFYLIGRRIYLANVWRFYSADPSREEEL